MNVKITMRLTPKYSIEIHPSTSTHCNYLLVGDGEFVQLTEAVGIQLMSMAQETSNISIKKT